jgi:hypothetical protein
MMRQHSKVVHASSGDVDVRAARLQERMATSVSVDWGAKRAVPNQAQRKGIPQPAVRKLSKDMTKSNIPAPAPAAQNAHKRVNSKEVAMGTPPLARKNSSGEYGRLFIKVVKLKELELPLPPGMSPKYLTQMNRCISHVLSTTVFIVLQRHSSSSKKRLKLTRNSNCIL